MGISGSDVQEVGLKIVLLGVREFDKNTKTVESNISGLNKSVQQTGAAIGKSSQQIGAYGDKLGSAGRNALSFSNISSTLTGSLTSLGKSFTTLGAALTLGVSIPLVALEGKLFTIGMSFEEAFSSVSKTVDGVSDDFGNLTADGLLLRNNIIGLTRELPLTANELSAVAAAAGQVGVPFGEGGKTILEFTKIAAGLGVATDIMAQDAAVALARVANIYGVTADEMVSFSSSFANSLVALGNTTAATESEILNMTLRLAPAANLAGIAADETLALAASMAEMGINAEAGGTALSTVILTMTEASKVASNGGDTFGAATEQMKDGLDKLRKALKSGVTDFTELEFVLKDTGLNLEGVSSMMKKLEDGTYSIDNIIQHVSMNTMMDMQKAMEDASTKTAIFADVLGVSEEQFAAAFGADPLQTLQRFLAELADLQDAGKISEQTLTELGFSGIRVRQVLNTLGPNMEALTANVELSNTQWVEQTALQVEVQKKFATTTAKMKLLKNAISEVGIAIFFQLKPSYDKLLVTVTEVINKFNDFLKVGDKNIKMFVNLLTALIAIGPALAIVGLSLRTLSIVISSMVSPLSFVFGIFTNPLLLLAVGALAAGFVLIKTNLFGLGKLLEGVGNAISHVFSGMFQSFKLLGLDKVLSGILKDLSSGNFDAAFEGLKLAWELLKISIERDILPEIKKQFALLKYLFSPALNELANWITTEGVSILKKTISTLFRLGISGSIAIGSFGVGILDTLIENIFGKESDISKSFKKIVARITAMSPLFEVAFNQVIGSALEGDFSGAIKKVGAIVKLLARAFGISLETDLLSTTANIFKKLSTSLLSLIKSIGTLIINEAKKIDWDAVLVELSKVGGRILGWLVGLNIKFIQLLANITEAFIDWAKGADWEEIGETAQKIWAAFKEQFVKGLEDVLGEEDVNKFFEIFNNLFNNESNKSFVQVIGEELIKQLGIGMLKATEFLRVNLAEWLNIELPETASWTEIGNALVNAVWEGMKAVWEDIKTWAKDQFNEAKTKFAEWLGVEGADNASWTEIGDALIQGILDGAKAVWEDFKTWIGGVFDNLIEDVKKKLGISSPSSVFLDIGKNIIQGLWDGIQSLWDMFITWFHGKVNEITSRARSILQNIYNTGIEIVNNIGNGISNAWNSFITWVGQKADEIKTKFGEVVNRMWELGKSIVDGLKQGISDQWDSFIGWITDQIKSIPVVGEIVLAVGSPSKVMAELGENIVLGLQEGMKNTFPAALESLRTQFEGLKTEAVLSSGVISSAMLGAATGSTISNTYNSPSNITNTNTFAPTITGVPMRDEVSAGKEAVRAWRQAQMIGNS